MFCNLINQFQRHEYICKSYICIMTFIELWIVASFLIPLPPHPPPPTREKERGTSKRENKKRNDRTQPPPQTNTHEHAEHILQLWEHSFIRNLSQAVSNSIKNASSSPHYSKNVFVRFKIFCQFDNMEGTHASHNISR